MSIWVLYIGNLTIMWVTLLKIKICLSIRVADCLEVVSFPLCVEHLLSVGKVLDQGI